MSLSGERGAPAISGFVQQSLPDYESHMPGYWLYQFLNIVTRDGRNYITYFRPKNLWVNTSIPDHRGLLVWGISDQSKNKFASCWFEEATDDHTDHD